MKQILYQEAVDSRLYASQAIQLDIAYAIGITSKYKLQIQERHTEQLSKVFFIIYMELQIFVWNLKEMRIRQS